MTLEQRDRLRLITAVALAALVGFTLLLRQRFAPMAEQLVITQVDNQASAAINDSIQQEIESGELDYDRLMITEKDGYGNVTALRANIAEINRLKTKILNRIDERLMDLSVEELGVPLGSILLPELFSGRGPELSVRVLAVRTSDAVCHNDFLAAGINQTLHRITIDINVTITILTLAGTQDVEVDSGVIAAETIIVGQVPSTYIGLEEMP